MKSLSINKQLQIALVFTLVILGMSGAITYNFMKGSQDDNALVNVLGRQRMLTQAMGKSVFGYASNKSDISSVANSVEGLDTYITQMRTVYTSSIIKKIKSLGNTSDLSISMNPHQESEASVPFPATFARLVNERFRNQDMERKILIDIIAENPVNPKQKLKSEIDIKANKFLSNNPSSLYFDHEKRDNKLHLLFYSADTATVKMCVSCHEKIKNQSFNIGDVLGIRKYDIEYGDLALSSQVLNPSLDEYESSLSIFKQTLESVINGGVIKGIPGGIIQAVDDSNFQNKASEVADKLERFEAIVNILIVSNVSESEIHKARKNLLEMSNELRKLSNDLVEIYSTIADENRHTSNLILLFSAILIASIIAAIVFALNNSVAKPLNKMSSTLDSLAKGNLTVSFEETQNNKEMTELSKNLNKVTDSFNGAIHKMLDLSGNIINSTDTSQEKVAELVHMSAQLSDQSSSVATSAEELTATTHEIAKSAESAANSAREANNAGDDGRHIVKNTMDSINDLAEKVETASVTIKTLEEDSKNIGGIIDVISDIAEQTNLLALNAAIEAARAGDQGRGFSVVADEVRNLAQRTQDATGEIQTMITKLQEGAQDAVTVMSQGQSQVEKTVDDANKVNEALIKITDEISVISDMNNQIASAAEQQAATTQELALNANSSHDNSTKVENSLTMDIAGELNNLSSVADELKETSDHFHL